MRSRVLGAVLVAALLNTSCTLAGTGAGLLIATSEPAYRAQPLPSPGEPPAALSPGAQLRIVLRTGASVKGEYVRFQPAGPSDVDSYLILRELQHRREQLRSIALSEVESIGVEYHDYSYVGIGALLGLIADVVVIGLLTNWFKNLSS